ncbi:hypothetical protein, partial [uncultured Endozoicomonas sp.]|uniref:hypothetical protein n=1 Tax=uncultured Endozoicomonas sp. TaxID=432652 RepID=UPI002636FF26
FIVLSNSAYDNFLIMDCVAYSSGVAGDNGDFIFGREWVDGRHEFSLTEYSAYKNCWIQYPFDTGDIQRSVSLFLSNDGRIAFKTNDGSFVSYVKNDTGRFENQVFIPPYRGDSYYNCVPVKDMFFIEKGDQNSELCQKVPGEQALVSKLQVSLPDRGWDYRLSPYGNLLLVEIDTGQRNERGHSVGACWEVYAPDKTGSWVSVGQVGLNIQVKLMAKVYFSARGNHLFIRSEEFDKKFSSQAFQRGDSGKFVSCAFPSDAGKTYIHGAWFSNDGQYMAIDRGDFSTSNNIQFLKFNSDKGWAEISSIPFKCSQKELRFTFSPDGNIAVIYDAASSYRNEACVVAGLNKDGIWVEKGRFDVKTALSNITRILTIEISPCNSFMRVITDNIDCPQSIWKLTPSTGLK